MSKSHFLRENSHFPTEKEISEGQEVQEKLFKLFKESTPEQQQDLIDKLKKHLCESS